MNKKSFENLTIVSVTGSTDYVQGSIYAIQRSCEELKGAKGLLISPTLPEGIILPENIEHQVIAPFGYLEYNLFILYQLDYFIHTDYCLIVQNDGWVLDGKNWRDEFWDYDYIGSPIPSYYKFEDGILRCSGTEFYLDNLELLNDPRYIEPQNGGFSFRSKKLLGIPRKLDIDYLIPPPEPFKENSDLKMKWRMFLHHEDIFLTVMNRDLLIKNGIKFAPSEQASFFSVESILLHSLRERPIDKVLGCHFFGNTKLIGYNQVQIQAESKLIYDTEEELQQIIDSALDVQLFRRAKYNIHILFSEDQFL